jgi:putative transposase
VVKELGSKVGIRRACEVLGFPSSTYYRRIGTSTRCGQEKAVEQETASSEVAVAERIPRKRPHPRALSPEQRQRILGICGSERFIDSSPAQIYATLLDEGVYFGSERTLYRVLSAESGLRDRRRLRRHPNYTEPVLVAEAPNQLWSWDITRLKGPQKGASYHLYVIIDVYSRYVVGWCVHDRECEKLAQELIATTVRRQKIRPNQLTVHADRGSSMRSKTVSELLAKLQVTRSHSRPYCSNDNPYSESQFKTMKYSSEFPGRFGSIEDARQFCRTYFEGYNMVHRHSGIALLSPSMLHHGEADIVLARRDAVLHQAFEEHPERFVRGRPTAKRPPQQAWINKPVEFQERGSSAEPSHVVNPPRRPSHGGGFSMGDGSPPATTVTSGTLVSA